MRRGHRGSSDHDHAYDLIERTLRSARIVGAARAAEGPSNPPMRLHFTPTPSSRCNMISGSSAG